MRPFIPIHWSTTAGTFLSFAGLSGLTAQYSIPLAVFCSCVGFLWLITLMRHMREPK